MREIKYRRVYENSKTGELIFICYCVSKTGQQSIINPDDWKKLMFADRNNDDWERLLLQSTQEPKWKAIGQDLYILDDSDGNEIYENDIVEENSPCCTTLRTVIGVDGKSYGVYEKKKILISSEKQASFSDYGGYYTIYGHNFENLEFDNNVPLFKKIGTKYEENKNENN